MISDDNHAFFQRILQQTFKRNAKFLWVIEYYMLCFRYVWTFFWFKSSLRQFLHHIRLHIVKYYSLSILYSHALHIVGIHLGGWRHKWFESRQRDGRARLIWVGVLNVSVVMSNVPVSRLQIGETPNRELRIITNAFNQVKYKGESSKKKSALIKLQLFEKW